MIDYSIWANMHREDLSMIPVMAHAGWIPKFHENDVFFQRITPCNVPNHSVGFELILPTNIKILAWHTPKIIKNKLINFWRAYYVTNGHTGKPRIYSSLEKLMEIETPK